MADPATYRPGPGFSADTVDHVRTYHRVMDGASKRACADVLRHVLKKHDDAVASVSDPAQREWFEKEFEDDVAAVRHALALITPPEKGGQRDAR